MLCSALIGRYYLCLLFYTFYLIILLNVVFYLILVCFDVSILKGFRDHGNRGRGNFNRGRFQDRGGFRGGYSRDHQTRGLFLNHLIMRLVNLL